MAEERSPSSLAALQTSLRTQAIAEDLLFPGEPSAKTSRRLRVRVPWRTVLWTAVIFAGAAVVTGLVYWKDHPTNLIMIYLLAVLLSAATLGRGPALAMFVMSVIALEYFSVPPIFGLIFSQSRYVFSLGVMLVVALVVSELSARARERALLAQEKEKRAEAQYLLSRDLSHAREVHELVSVAAQHIKKAFRLKVSLLLSGAHGSLKPAYVEEGITMADDELQAASRSFELRSIIRPQRSPNCANCGLYVPMIGASRTVGVLGVLPGRKRPLIGPSEMNLLLAFANQTAVAIERSVLWKATEEANLLAEKERLRSTLLSSVSHDLHTPLSAITGAASSLLASPEGMSPTTARELVQSIYDEADRLNRLVANLLDMTRLESGTVTVKKEWHVLEEVIGAAITRLERRLRKYKVTVLLPEDLPLIAMDELLMQQVFINLLDNAAKYAPAGSEIQISASASNSDVRVEVFNQGPGLAPDEEVKIFDKFFRGKNVGTAGGAGLGLAICRAIIEAHHGRIWAASKPQEGVRFLFTLPLEGEAPHIDKEVENMQPASHDQRF